MTDLIHAKVAWSGIRHNVGVPEMPPMPAYFASASVVFVGSTVANVTGQTGLLWQPVGIMFLALLVLFTADLLTEYFGMPPESRGVFLWEREITGKIMLVSLVVISLVLDVVIYSSAKHLPHSFKFLDHGYLFVTLTTLLWLIGATVSHITRNVAMSEGTEMVPPTLNVLARQIRWVLRTMKFIDDRRVGAVDGERLDEIKTTQRPSRWYDSISDAEVEELAAFLQARQNLRHAPTSPPADIIVKDLEHVAVPPKPPGVIAKEDEV